MQYVALFQKEKHGFSVRFPDFPGCATCGDDLDEAVDHAHEALSLYLEEYFEDGRELPAPSPKKELLARPENKGLKAISIVVHEDGSNYEEFEVSMHKHLLARIEKYCAEYGVSPADFFAVAARKAIKGDVFAE